MDPEGGGIVPRGQWRQRLGEPPGFFRTIARPKLGSSPEAGERPSRNDATDDSGGKRSPSSSPDSQLPCCNVRPSVSLFQKQTAVTAVRVYACLMLTYFCMDLTTKGTYLTTTR